MLPTDNIGILYSTATGIVLRSINPPQAEQGHLTWLQNNLPQGTTLLLINKQAIGADDNNMPNMDTIIPYAQQNNSLTLSYGKTCVVVDVTNKVSDIVLCCPFLYQQALNVKAVGSLVLQKIANIGDIYNPSLGTFTPSVTGPTV